MLVSKLFEDLKARERRNKTDMGTTRRGLNRTQELQQSMYIRLDEGLTSLSGKVGVLKLKSNLLIKYYFLQIITDDFWRICHLTQLSVQSDKVLKMID